MRRRKSKASADSGSDPNVSIEEMENELTDDNDVVTVNIDKGWSKHDYDDTIKSAKNKNKLAKREFTTYKYSNRGKAPLHEAIILEGRPVFLKYKHGDLEVIKHSEEINRIIKAPSHEEYPYEPYEFTSCCTCTDRLQY